MKQTSMKKAFKNIFCFISTLLLTLSLFAMSGCKDKDSTDTLFSEPATEASSDTKETEYAHTKDWTEQELISMFTNTMDDSCSIIDCILIPDYAYERVGALLYLDSKKGTTNVAFIDADGFSQSCGVYAKAHTNAGFNYLGDGKVTFVLESQSGEAYNCYITLSIDGSNVNFIVEDDF